MRSLHFPAGAVRHHAACLYHSFTSQQIMRQLILLLLILPGSLLAAGKVTRIAKHIDAQIVAQQTAVQPGQPLRIAVRLQMDSSWHIYWKNPGDAGLATAVDWTLPEGCTISNLEWPQPHLFGDPPEVCYGYEGQVLLMATLTPPATITTPTLTIGATVELLACQDVCIPGKGKLELTIPVADASSETEWSQQFQESAALVPASTETISGASVQRTSQGLQLLVPIQADTENAWFFAAEEGVIDHSGQQSAAPDGNGLVLMLPASPFPNKDATRLRGVLVVGKHRAVELDLPLPAVE